MYGLGLRNLSAFTEQSPRKTAVTADMIFFLIIYLTVISLVIREVQSKILINLEDNIIAIIHAYLNKVVFGVR